MLVDHASGVLDRRAELDKVLERLRPGDTQVVWHLDRLGRSLRHQIDTSGGRSADQTEAADELENDQGASEAGAFKQLVTELPGCCPPADSSFAC